MGAAQDLPRAAALYTRAAELGHVPAMLALAHCHENAIGTAQNKNAAYALYKKAAKSGEADGFYHVGRCLLYGIGTGRDPENAVAALRRAAHDGNLSALLLLADCHRTGTGAEQSALLYCSLLEKVAVSEVRGARTPVQELETVAFFEHPDKRAIASALFRLGQYHATGISMQHDFALTLEYYGRAMIEGSHEAMDEMARISASGQSIESYYQSPPSGTTAPVSDAKRIEAVNRMGDLWFYGRELPKDLDMAVKCFGIAAKAGNVSANYSLGWCEKYGKGTKQDAESAVKHLKIAADAGHPHACFSLGECYENGEGVAQRDRRKAIDLYKKAAAKGHAAAAKRLAELEK